MLKIVVNNVTSQILDPLDKSVKNQIDKKLSYTLPGAYFAQKYSPWAGVKHLFKIASQTFPTGLIHYVRDILNEAHVSYSIQDNRTPITLGTELPLHDVVLRDYQENTIETAIKKQRGIIKVGTGGGKTVIIGGIIGKLNVPTLILTHKLDLLYQLQSRLQSMLQVPVGMIGDGHCDLQRITVGMIQTIAYIYEGKPKKKKTDEEDDEFDEKAAALLSKADKIKYIVENVQCMLVDECHHTPADSFVSVHQHAEKAFYRIGFSASPWREDNADLLIEAYHAKQLVDIPSTKLIGEGHLVPPLVFLYEFDHGLTNEDPRPYAQLYDDEIVRNASRNEIVVNAAVQAVAAGKTVLIAVKKIEHGQILESLVKCKEPDAIFVCGDSDSDVRLKVLTELNQRKRKIVICTTIFGEGIDIPNLDVLINAKASKSSVDAFQLIGRVLRKEGSKTKAYVVDIFDTHCKYAQRHAKARLKIYKTETGYILREVSDPTEFTFQDIGW